MSKAAKRMIFQTAETREKILQVAEAMFVERGFFDTQMKDVAVAVDISRNSLYRYFADKVDLGYAVMHKVFLRMEPRLNHYLKKATRDPNLSALEQLRLLADAMIVEDDLKAELCFMAEFDAYFSGNRVPADFQARFAGTLPSAMWSRLQELAAAGVKDGSIRQDLTPEEVTGLVLYSLKVLQEHILTRRSALVGMSVEQVDRLLPNLLTVLIDGLRPVSTTKVEHHPR
jgi:AcrR family transcriptional regulator